MALAVTPVPVTTATNNAHAKNFAQRFIKETPLLNLALCYYSTINPIILLCAGAKLGTTDKKETDR
jgi:hypothetical protein